MAAVKNLYIDQGSDFVVEIAIYDDNNAPWNLSNYIGEAKIRKSYYSTNYVDFVVSFAATRTSGKVILELTSSQTSSLEQGRYLYDVVLTNPFGKKIRVIEGIVTINAGVT